MHAKIKPFLDGKFMVYGCNCWNTGNLCIFFPRKFGTIFAGKLISGTHTMGTPVPSNDITIFLNDRYSCLSMQVSKRPKWHTVVMTRKLVSTYYVNRLQRKLLEALCHTLWNISCPFLLMAKCIKTNEDNIMSYKHDTIFKNSVLFHYI